MRVIDNVAEMKAFTRGLRGTGRSIGLVPTMGYLHDGHLSLVRASKADNDTTVLSIFVNPTQFGPAEDLARYPRDMEGDLAKCGAEGVDVVFAPDGRSMYPEGYCTYIEVTGISDVLCGASRPGHFRGVATVVAKLFDIVAPHRAYFGRKDYQQTVVIKSMAADLDMDVDVVVMPTVREPDGLAMSSRNSYLAPDERKAATVLYRALSAAKEMRGTGVTDAAALLARARGVIGAEPAVQVEYIELVDKAGLKPVADVGAGAVMALAARLGKTRLIDNMEI